MMYNPRRLEALGYSLSVLLFQGLIAGHEDVFLICPQFPIHLSPEDTNLDPDCTMPDSRARGVYVDTALLLARCTRVRTATGSIAHAFRQAYQDRDFDLSSKLDITSLEVPILEERKRGPTRHPRDLEDLYESIRFALGAAQKQVSTQAEILFSSPRFLDQNLVILLATAGEYYRIAVLKRDHTGLLKAPSLFDVEALIRAHTNPDLGDDTEDLSELLLDGSTIQEERHRLEQSLREQEIARQIRERDARADARAARKETLSRLVANEFRKSLLVLDAGPPPYPDGMLERYYKLDVNSDGGPQRYPTFFEPEPIPGETILSLAQFKNPELQGIAFTGAIRLGSSVSNKFVEMIKAYITEMAHAERARRE
jgi:hypothetical protein